MSMYGEDYQRGYSDGIKFQKNKNSNDNYNYILDKFHDMYYDLIDGRDARAKRTLLALCKEFLEK